MSCRISTDISAIRGRLPGERGLIARLHPAWTITAVALPLALWRLDGPSLWLDEAATWSAVDRPLDELFALAGRKDRPLFPYYLFMHFWARFGMSEAWLRLPSALAGAAAAGVTAAIGARLWSPRAGLVAGLLLLAAPDWSRYAQEARPYAFALLFTAVASYTLIRAMDTGTWWPAYAVAMAAATTAHFVTLLLLCAHAAGAIRRGVVTATAFRDEPPLRAWAQAAGSALLPAAVLVTWSVTQPTPQLTWSPPDIGDLFTVWSDIVGSDAVASLLVVLAVGALWRRGRAPVLLVVWALIPPVALFAAARLTPLWAPRYLLFVLPAMAVLAGIAAAAPRARSVPALLVAAALAAGLPGMIAVRGPGGHGQDYRAAARIIEADATPRTAVVLSPSWQRSGLAYYLRNGAVVDVMAAADRPADALHAPEAPAEAVPARLAPFQRVWWIRFGGRPRSLDARDRAKQAALDRWFRPTRTVHVEGLLLTRYDR